MFKCGIKIKKFSGILENNCLPINTIKKSQMGPNKLSVVHYMKSLTKHPACDNHREYRSFEILYPLPGTGSDILIE